MNRICFLGNSHLGALNYALPQHHGYKDLDVTFWGAAGGHFAGLKYVNGKVISPKPEYSELVSGGKYRELEVDDFDAIVFYGCLVGTSRFVRRVALEQKRTPRLSLAVRREVIYAEFEAFWQRLRVRVLMERIVQDFPRKTYLLYSHPLIAKGSNYFREFNNLEFVAFILEHFNDFLCQKATEIGVNFRTQPIETIEDDVYTQNVFTTGSVKLATDGEQHPDNDFRHMNAEYGMILLDDILQVIQKNFLKTESISPEARLVSD